MKFLCVACDEAMTLIEATDAPRGDALAVTFRCPRCEQRIALLANPWETQLVRSLGVTLGGRTAPPEPLELTRGRLAESRLLWTKEAEERLARIPEFVRAVARESIERYALEQGYREVTFRVMDEARARIGM